MENRRRLHRQPAGWAASDQLAGEQAAGWRDCRVVDISMLGLGITVDHPDPSELTGRLVSVNLPSDGSCVNVRLEGQIKNASATMGRDIRVGVEFIRLSETEQAITAVLSVLSDVLVAT
ncbi:MAG TPA: PilZ domain-containing protein [Acidimicrobiales bacterium]